MVVSRIRLLFRPQTSQACFIWDTCLTIPFRIFWSVVPVCRGRTLVGCRERTMLPLQPKRKSWIALHSRELRRLTWRVKISWNMLGNGRKNTEASSLSSCVSWGRPVIGTVRLSRWTNCVPKVWSRFLSISIIKDWYIVVSVWWTGIRKRWLPCPTKRLYIRKSTANCITSATRWKVIRKAVMRLSQQPVPKQSWGIRPCVSIRTTRRTLGWKGRKWLFRW